MQSTRKRIPRRCVFAARVGWRQRQIVMNDALARREPPLCSSFAAITRDHTPDEPSPLVPCTRSSLFDVRLKSLPKGGRHRSGLFDILGSTLLRKVLLYTHRSPPRDEAKGVFDENGQEPGTRRLGFVGRVIIMGRGRSETRTVSIPDANPIPISVLPLTSM